VDLLDGEEWRDIVLEEQQEEEEMEPFSSSGSGGDISVGLKRVFSSIDHLDGNGIPVWQGGSGSSALAATGDRAEEKEDSSQEAEWEE
jgi:hypothetical protein